MRSKSPIMRFYFSLIVLFVTVQLQAQFGVSSTYDLERAPGWDDLAAAVDSVSRGDQYAAIGFHYWFRLKNRRIEFAPEIMYRRNFGNQINSRAHALTHSIDLNFNTDFYVFDLGSDCNCPTFSKDGNILTKGFFIEVSPGASLRQYHVDPAANSDGSLQADRISGILFKFGLGAGLDIGVNDLLTITPFIKHEWHFGADWQNYATNVPDFILFTGQSDLSFTRLGLRLTFRPDYRPFR